MHWENFLDDGNMRYVVDKFNQFRAVRAICAKLNCSEPVTKNLLDFYGAWLHVHYNEEDVLLHIEAAKNGCM